MNNLEHIANNGTDTTKHTDVYNAQFWARRAPSVDAHVFTHRTCGSRSRLVCHSISSMHAHLCVVSWVVSPHPSLYFFLQFLFQLYLMSIPAPDEISIEDQLCNSSLESMVTLDYVTLLTIRYKDTYDIFFGIEYRMRKEEVEEKFNKKAKQGGGVQQTLRESPTKMQAARVASTRRSDGAVFDEEDWAAMSSPGNEGRVAQAWVNVRRGVPCFCRVLLALRRMDTEEWGVDGSSGQAGETHQASVAQKASSLKGRMIMPSPAKVCRATSRAWRPHKTVTSLVERDKEIQEVWEVHVPHCCSVCLFLPSRVGCNSMEWVAMEGMLQALLGDVNRLDRFSSMFFQCVLFGGRENVSPGTCAVGVANQRTDSPALCCSYCDRCHDATVSKHNKDKTNNVPRALPGPSGGKKPGRSKAEGGR